MEREKKSGIELCLVVASLPGSDSFSEIYMYSYWSAVSLSVQSTRVKAPRCLDRRLASHATCDGRSKSQHRTHRYWWEIYIYILSRLPRRRVHCICIVRVVFVKFIESNNNIEFHRILGCGISYVWFELKGNKPYSFFIFN